MIRTLFFGGRISDMNEVYRRNGNAPFFLFVIACVSLAASPGLVFAQEAQRHARVELVSQRLTVAPGEKSWLAVHFTLDPGWHIYWQNPGDSGQPPALKWQIPDGFTVGEIQWPRPEKLKNGPLADYGYKDEVTLLASLQVPIRQEGMRIEIAADATWLVCREVCVPERDHLHVSLPVARAPVVDPAQTRLFDEARKKLPLPWLDRWSATVESLKDSFVLTLNAGSSVQQAEFFPLQASEIDNAAPQILKTTPKGGQLTLKKSDQLMKPVPVLKGLLVVDGVAYRFQARVVERKKSQ